VQTAPDLVLCTALDALAVVWPDFAGCRSPFAPLEVKAHLQLPVRTLPPSGVCAAAWTPANMFASNCCWLSTSASAHFRYKSFG
jgi:hypothetical protein